MSTADSNPEKSLGEHWLELLGYEDLVGQPTTKVIDGQPVLFEHFDQICGDHVRPFFNIIERFDPDTPEYKDAFDILREAVEYYRKQPEANT